MIKLGSQRKKGRTAGYLSLAFLCLLLALVAALQDELRTEGYGGYLAHILLVVGAAVATLLALRTPSPAEDQPSSLSGVEVPSRDLRAIVSVATLARAGQDVSTVLDHTLDKALEITGLKEGAIYFPAEPSGKPVPSVCRGPRGHRDHLESFPFREELVALVIDSGQPVVSDGRTPIRSGEPRLQTQEEVTWAIVPIPCQRVRGALCVAQRWSGGLPNGCVGSLTALGQVAGVVLDSLKMFEEGNTNFHEMRVLHQISLEITSKLDAGSVVKSLVERATELMGGFCGAVYLANDDSDKLTRVAGVLSGEHPWDETIKICDWLASHVVSKGISTIVSGDHLLEGAAVQWSENRPAPSAVCAPLRWQGETRGAVLVLVEGSAGPPSSDDLQLLRLMANQAAIAVQNSKLYSQANRLFVESVGALSDAIEIRDAYTAGHSQQIALYCLAVARELRLSEKEQELLHFAALLHDIGKIGVSDAILRKPGRLSAQELVEMRRHCAIGARVAKRIDKLRPVVPIIYHHHERYDGEGYPDGLKGEEIPLLARVLAVADTLGAMTSDRPYREAFSIECALDEIRKASGSQFDSMVVEALLRALTHLEVPPRTPGPPVFKSLEAVGVIGQMERQEEPMRIPTLDLR
ncbi:MAG: HD domain-containing protein [Anaerolineae bacterium]|nr:HD domain-containing protein [Anaerolineae bacterium]